jgi:transposase, IS5 family
MGRLPDESAILRFRHLLEENNLSIQLLATINATIATKGLMLEAGTVVDAALIAVPSSTKNSTGDATLRYIRPRKASNGTLA